MKHLILTSAVLAAMLASFSVGTLAQHEEHHPQDQATQPQTQGAPAPTPAGPSAPATMGSGMMGMGAMGQMMTRHQQMNETMTKIMQSMAAIENEKDPAALKAKLAAHRALIEQMRNQMMEEGGMMQQMQNMMQQMMGGMGGRQASPAK